MTDPRPTRTSAAVRGEAYSLALDDVPCPALVVEDETGRVVAANARAGRLYGRSRADFAGVAWAEIVVPAAGSTPDARPAVGPARHLRADGTAFDAAVIAGPLRGSDPAATLVLVEDVSGGESGEEARPSRDELRDFARRLQAAREEEQERIGREVHDEIGQSLAALRMNLSWLQGRLEGSRAAPLRARVDEMIVDVDEAIAGVRRVARELRPPILERLGLSSALRDLVDRTVGPAGIPCDVHIDFDERLVDRERGIAVYRIVQEALTNVIGHAGAGSAALSIVVESGTLVAQVLDDGVGIPAPNVHDPKAMGLMGMRERARVFGGDVVILGDVGGTSVVARIPLAPPREEAP